MKNAKEREGIPGILEKERRLLHAEKARRVHAVVLPEGRPRNLCRLPAKCPQRSETEACGKGNPS